MRTWDLRGSGYFMSELLATDLLRASAYHLAGIKIRPKTGKEELSGILIKRREMRRILNHPILLSSLRESFVHKVSFSGIVLEKLLPVDQIRLFEKTDIVIGTHGAGLVNSIFLLPQSHVLENCVKMWKCPINLSLQRERRVVSVIRNQDHSCVKFREFVIAISQWILMKL